MKFAYTILYVPDVVRAIEFYERAFGFQRGFVPGRRDTGCRTHHVEFDRRLQVTGFSMRTIRGL